MQILDRRISPSAKPYVIAEVSANHGGDLNRALDMVAAAAEAGACAVKFQTYTADTITIRCDRPEFRIENPDSLWRGRTLHDLYNEAHMPWEWHARLFEEARRQGIHSFSSAFDETAVDYLEALDVPCYKVASFEHTFIPLLEKVAETKKPLIVSCGLATFEDIWQTVQALKDAASGPICLLSCTSNYPAAIEDSNLRRIPAIKTAFPDCQVGLSDHTVGHTAAIAAVALGACVFEKHFKLADDRTSVDAAFSATPAELKEYISRINDAWSALGEAKFGPASAAEAASMQFRRSIYAVADINEGEAFTIKNIRCIRPGRGLHTKYFKSVLGRTAKQSISYGTPLSLDLISE
ncbi:pseudaminic acid synthase [Sphingorhabdus buctiana]|uniref:Pseudaminic acid synthase n=1 Tax=Sphingorhabdus buctiana TaxID=1508805 RepID=A0ABW4MCF7_9SPHN